MQSAGEHGEALRPSIVAWSEKKANLPLNPWCDSPTLSAEAARILNSPATLAWDPFASHRSALDSW